MSPSFTYKNITNAQDIEQLLGKSSHYNDFTYSYTDDTINLLKRNFSLPDSLYILVQDNDTFVGFVSIDKDWWEENSFFLREIFVESSYQGQGVGQSLMNKCISHAKEHGANQLVTQTALDNIPMQKLCEKNGLVRWDNPQWQEGITYKLVF
jgi:GNAT superfamily N-acetyltransferase